ncbi:GHMP family kinase ATP-binding protein [Bacillus sp. Hm123]|uniref:GHMP family kinase ATP-binding protein n=1 Tax=Bacillus sp. Hm123 TaxID=3450745 RepID=UPI003F43FF48
MRVGIGKCFGTFGELAQGEIDGQPFLFTFPSPLYSEARFTPAQVGSLIGETKGKKLALMAAEQTLRMLGRSPSGYLSITSSIPVGKGMASSSADIVATIRAVTASVGATLSAKEEAMIAANIEPTDGVMHRGITAINQQTGELLHEFPHVPELVCIGFDSGGRVNTRAFHRNKKDYNEAEKQLLEQIFYEMTVGLTDGNVEQILRAATASSQVNERFLPKPKIRLFVDLATELQGGVIIGHSGTVIGLLFDRQDPFLLQKRQKAIEQVRIETGWNPLIIF